MVLELSSLIKGNIWLRYFKETYESRKEADQEGWIDFESEISKIIQLLDNASHMITEQINQGKKSGNMTQQQFDLFGQLFPLVNKLKIKDCGNVEFKMESISYLKEIFLKDLYRLIRCLEIYLSDYVSNLGGIQLLPDIESLPIIDKVLSFNYTGTYEDNYKTNPYLEVDYIHGRANIKNTIDNNNMVLGIDKYLRGDNYTYFSNKL